MWESIRSHSKRALKLASDIIRCALYKFKIKRRDVLLVDNQRETQRGINKTRVCMARELIRGSARNNPINSRVALLFGVFARSDDSEVGGSG